MCICVYSETLGKPGVHAQCGQGAARAQLREYMSRQQKYTRIILVCMWVGRLSLPGSPNCILSCIITLYNTPDLPDFSANNVENKS